jgi:tRNA threonylcarbamoyl adenosine modification protein YeaZ
MTYPLTLVIDSSTPTLFLGLLKQGQFLDAHVETLDRLQSEWMMPRLIDLLQRHHYLLHQVDAIVVGDGPGSFTGVRLALTLVKTLALLKPTNVYPIQSLQLMAVHPTSAVWLDARGGRMYLGVYQGTKIILDATIHLQADKTDIETRHPKAKWIDASQAFSSPRLIVAQAQAWIEHTKPINDIHKLNPRYLKAL